MLFHSVAFLYFFLPATLVIFWLSPRAVRPAVLLVASLFFYAWWNPRLAPLLILSITANFLISSRILIAVEESRSRLSSCWAVFGIALNLAVLGYFKYRLFVLELAGLGSVSPGDKLVIPLAISFFTFQQIAFLVDTWRGEVGPVNPIRYAAYVSFFPQLIAGPIVRHDELLPQFEKNHVGERLYNLILGASLFTLGLFKKTVLADGIAGYGTPVFQLADDGANVAAFDAWTAIASYHLQIYFDFSGYSTMAIGLGKMFGFHLPINFRSPYKAASIVDFWRNWHITLSRFLRDYLYIPLGGNRRGPARRYINLTATMLLGGLWHGAAWGYVLWGALHGLFLVINTFWRGLFGRPVLPLLLGIILTSMLVMLAWVPFKMETLDGTLHFYQAMLGYKQPECLNYFCTSVNNPTEVLSVLALGLGIVFLLPSAEQFFGYGEVGELRRLQWSPSRGWAIVVAVIFMASIFSVVTVGGTSEFLYFQF